MGGYATVTLVQWVAIAKIQQAYGVPDKLLAAAVGCGATTIVGRRKAGGWTKRKLPEGFVQEAARPVDDEPEAEADINAMPDELALQAALARLLAMIVRSTANAAAADADPLDMKRLEALTNAAKSFERLMELKARVTPGAGPQQNAEETAQVLAQIDRRVDELADRRARYIITQCCRAGDCRAELPAGR